MSHISIPYHAAAFSPAEGPSADGPAANWTYKEVVAPETAPIGMSCFVLGKLAPEDHMTGIKVRLA